MYPTTAPPTDISVFEHNHRKGLPSFGIPSRGGAELLEYRREAEAHTQEVRAYHEAGHAIVACALGFNDVVVDMKPDDPATGALTRYVPRGRWSAENRAARELSVACAGGLAEIRRFGDFESRGCKGDFERVAELWPIAGEARAEQAYERTRKLLATQEPTLEWVAKLLKHNSNLKVDSHRMADNTLEWTALVYRSELMPCELVGSMRSHPGSIASEEGVQDEPRHSPEELKQLAAEGKAYQKPDGTCCCATCDRECLMNAIAEVEAGLPSTEAEAIKEYVIVRARLLNQDELLPEGWQ